MAMVLAAIVLLSWKPTMAQSGPESYALLHLWGLSTHTTVESLAMGETYVATGDPFGGNPGAVGTLRRVTAKIQHDETSLQSGFSIHTSTVQVGLPLAMGNLVFTCGETTTGTLTTSTIFPLPFPVQLSGRDDGFSIAYGRRVGGPKFPLYAGISLAPRLASHLELSGPFGFSATVDSAPVGMGGRLGMLYIGQRWNAGLTYEYYQEKSRMRTQGPLGTPPTLQEAIYSSSNLRPGVQYRLFPGTLISTEWNIGDFTGPGIGLKRNSLHLGLRQDVGVISLMAGLSDRQPTAGLVLRMKDLELSYAFQANRENDIIQPRFGTSSTNSLMLSVKF